MRRSQFLSWPAWLYMEPTAYQTIDPNSLPKALRHHVEFLAKPGAVGQRLKLEGCDLTQAQLGSQLDKAIFERCRFAPGQQLTASMKQCQFKSCLLRGVHFVGSLQDAAFEGASGSPIDLSEATVDRANGVRFTHAALQGTTLHYLASEPQAILTIADSAGAVWLVGDLIRLQVQRSVIWLDFSRVTTLEGCTFDQGRPQVQAQRKNVRNTIFSGCDLSDSLLSGSMLSNVRFTGGPRVSLRNVDFTAVQWTEDSLIDGAIVDGACFARCKNLRGRYAATLLNILGAERARYSHRADLASWALIRNIGSIPLFGVSSTALVFFWLLASAVEFYNRQVGRFHSHEASDHLPWADRLLPIELSYENGVLLAALLLLAIASGIYRFRCPDIVKEHTETEWRYKLGHQVMVYRIESYAYPAYRWISAVLYLLGGGYVLYALLCRIVWTLRFFFAPAP